LKEEEGIRSLSWLLLRGEEEEEDIVRGGEVLGATGGAFEYGSDGVV
jgi:hypothetical protein